MEGDHRQSVDEQREGEKAGLGSHGGADAAPGEEGEAEQEGVLPEPLPGPERDPVVGAAELLDAHQFRGDAAEPDLPVGAVGLEAGEEDEAAGGGGDSGFEGETFAADVLQVVPGEAPVEDQADPKGSRGGGVVESGEDGEGAGPGPAALSGAAERTEDEQDGEAAWDGLILHGEDSGSVDDSAQSEGGGGEQGAGDWQAESLGEQECAGDA